ncbi:LysE family transporter [Methanosarcina hadiensis]|uniref:LysE family transporter n=1 Tax=Methanosarcina hadiensis TaxID=3078083 RepID=UPI003977D08F
MLIIEIFGAFLLGFTIGFTGALVPGPMLFATIELSLKRGWLAGPEIFLGHMLVELMLFILILFGFTSFISSSAVSSISVIGGFALTVFGLLTVKDAKNAASAGISQGTPGLKLTSNPIASGLITSVSNPYFWIWWLTAGSALVLREHELGIFISLAYIVGHWTADLSWFTAVSGSFSRGKALLSENAHRFILYACGIFLISFGFYFMLNSSNAAQLF